MPWKEHRLMGLKIEFVEKATAAGAKIAPLCREYGISRETGHKWVKRYREEGYDGLEERSRRPSSAPLAMAEDMVLAVLGEREKHPRWGPKKLADVLRRRFGEATPSRATIARILKRFGMVRRRRRRATLSIVERAPTVTASAPNDIWTVDFKGWWRAGDGHRCEPLTVRDAHSRYVLCAKLIDATTVADVKKEFEALFRRYGVPKAIQCDNGVPFVCSQSRGGLSALSAWWVSLGIQIVRSRPGCPQDNGGHERMHRDMAADVEGFPKADRIAEQRALARWRQEFNHVRPHEALGGKTPAEVYAPGTRRSLRPVPWSYPPEWTSKRVAAPKGRIFVAGEHLHVGTALIGQIIALEPLHPGAVRLWFHDVDLGELSIPPSTNVIDVAADRFLDSRRRRTKKAA
jgi:putative transposase